MENHIRRNAMLLGKFHPLGPQRIEQRIADWIGRSTRTAPSSGFAHGWLDNRNLGFALQYAARLWPEHQSAMLGIAKSIAKQQRARDRRDQRCFFSINYVKNGKLV